MNTDEHRYLRRYSYLCLSVSICGGLAAVVAQGGDDGAFSKIRAEGMERSQVQAMFSTLTDEIGPRLTASPAFRRAVCCRRE